MTATAPGESILKTMKGSPVAQGLKGTNGNAWAVMNTGILRPCLPTYLALTSPPAEDSACLSTPFEFLQTIHAFAMT